MEKENPGFNSKAMIKMLGELADMAEDATLTGALGSGVPRAVERYNSVLKQLVDHEVVPANTFTPLPADATFGDLAVDARLLRAYVKEGNGNGLGGFAPEKHLILRLAPFANSSDLRELVDSYLAKGSPVDAGLIESLAPFLDSEHLGVLIRKIAKQGQQATHEPAPPNPPKPPAEMMPPTPPTAPHGPHAHHEVSLSVHDEEGDEQEPEALVHHDVPVEDRLRALTDRMRDPEISAEEFEELSAEVLRLKREMKGR